eukprot:9548105-Karenia_brevis.AAC.1
MDMYAKLRRRFRFCGSVGHEFAATNGILQGCPLSVILLNALMVVLAKAVDEEVPEVRLHAYVDDLNGTGPKPKFVQQALDIVGDFARLTRQEINICKSKCFATSTTRMHRLRVGDELLQQSPVLKSVGAVLETHAGHAQVEIAQKLD